MKCGYAGLFPYLRLVQYVSWFVNCDPWFSHMEGNVTAQKGTETAQINL